MASPLTSHTTAVLATLAVMSVHTSLCGQTSASRKTESEITTWGSGESTLSPQRAVLRIGVASHATAAAEASAQNARILGAVLDTLARAGFPRESLQTVAFGVGPNYDYKDGKRLVDYEAEAAVRLIVKDLRQVGRLIDMALAAGATDVGNVGFESDSMDAGRRQALAQALSRARGDAVALATAAGGSLGRLLEMKTTNGYYPVAFDEAYASNQAAFRTETPITPRDVVIHVAVEAHWEFVPHGRRP